MAQKTRCKTDVYGVVAVVVEGAQGCIKIHFADEGFSPVRWLVGHDLDKKVRPIPVKTYKDILDDFLGYRFVGNLEIFEASAAEQYEKGVALHIHYTPADTATATESLPAELPA